MRKGQFIIGFALGVAIVMLAPDVWANTGFTKVDEVVNKLLVAAAGLGGAVCAGGVVETLTGWKFGHTGVMGGGFKTGVTGAGVGGSGAIATFATGSGTSFDGSMLPVSEVMTWAHAALAFFS